MDAAVAAKLNGAAKEAPSRMAPHKARRTDHKDRRSNKATSGLQERSKKGGAGKGNWGVMAEEQAPDLDPHDPNYDSDNAQPAELHQDREVQERVFKKAAASVFDEYLTSGDVAEVVTSLHELDQPGLEHLFVKRALATAMDKHDREREMTSALLSTLYDEVISPAQMSLGFSLLVSALEDLVLDVPQAVEHMARFVARAVVDDVLPPAFVAGIDGSPPSGSLLRARCESLLEGRHASERLLRCWGNKEGLDLEGTRGSISSLLREYLGSNDVGEAARLMRGMAVPFYHHELVKQALQLALADPPSWPALSRLLGRLSETGEVSPLQLHKGYHRCVAQLADTALDSPGAPSRMGPLLTTGLAMGWLEEEAFNSLGSLAQGALSAAQCAVSSFKSGCALALGEYYESEDVGEVAQTLEGMDQPGLHHLFVKLALRTAMDRRDRERELTSALLAGLTPHPLAREAAAAGFTRLLAELEDTLLDSPTADALATLFLARAVVDEVVPPAALQGMVERLPGGVGVRVVQDAVRLLSARHSAERLQCGWHARERGVGELREEVKGLLREYLANPDDKQVAEVSQSLQSLSIPHYHHEVVRQALIMAFDQPTRGGELMKLLGGLAEGNHINATQMGKGLARVSLELDDLCLDFPGARGQFEAALQTGRERGWLDGATLEEMEAAKA